MTLNPLRLLAWGALFALAFATLSPIGLRPRLPLPVDIERGLAFLVVGLLFALAYPRRIWWALAILLVGVFGLELLQMLRSDRHGRLDDALVKAAGAIIGLGTGWLIAQWHRQRRPPTP